MLITEMLGALAGGARTNKFKVLINIPPLLSMANVFNNLTGNTMDTLDKKTIALLAKETTIPSKSISVAEVWHRGRKFPIRGRATFDNKWDVTFYNDSSMSLRGMFEEWMYQIDSFDSVLLDTAFINNYLGIDSYNTGYMTNLTLQQLCANDTTVLAEYEIMRAFPINISSQSLSSSDSNAISSFTVTFSYDFWKRKSTNSTANSIGDFISNFT